MKSKKSKLSAIVFFSVMLALALALPDMTFGLQYGDFTYTVSGGTITITKYTGTGGDVVIPPTINSLPVVSIGDYAFEDFSGLTSVTIPDCVISIGIGAFQYCSGLTRVTIPDSVTIIGHLAFNNCDHLTSVIIPESVTSIGDAAFDQCSSLTSVTIPNSVTRIGACAFYRCIGLTSVTIGNGVTSIGYGAFYECTTLTKAYFLGNVPRMEMGFIIVGGSYVHYGVFDYCANNFTVCYTAGSTGFTTPSWCPSSDQCYPAYPCAKTTSTTTSLQIITTTIVPWEECSVSVISTILPLNAGLLPHVRRIVITGENSNWNRSTVVSIEDIKTVILLRVQPTKIIALIVLPSTLGGFMPGEKEVGVATGADLCVGAMDVE
jgi:hypothetical protein